MAMACTSVVLSDEYHGPFCFYPRQHSIDADPKILITEGNKKAGCTYTRTGVRPKAFLSSPTAGE